MNSAGATLSFHQHSLKAMGSRCEFKLYAPAAEGAALLELASQRLNQLEQKYTRYQSSSVTAQINAAAGCGEALRVDEETQRLLDYAHVLYLQSDGRFDITSGILRQAGDFRSGKLPEQAQLDQLLPLIGWPQVSWEPPFFYLPKAGMQIDLGGFVKEYAADQIAQLVLSQGVQHGLVNLGGDIRVLGPHPDGSPWIVGIQHPRQAGRAIAQIPLQRGAIATSGDYERFMLVKGKRYSHLLDPHTGWPIESRFASVSVLAPQCVLAGSFSTIALLKGDLANADKKSAATEQRQDVEDWLAESGISYLCIDQQLQFSGNIQRQDYPTPNIQSPKTPHCY